MPVNHAKNIPANFVEEWAYGEQRSLPPPLAPGPRMVDPGAVGNGRGKWDAVADRAVNKEQRSVRRDHS